MRVKHSLFNICHLYSCSYWKRFNPVVQHWHDVQVVICTFHYSKMSLFLKLSSPIVNFLLSVSQNTIVRARDNNLSSNVSFDMLNHMMSVYNLYQHVSICWITLKCETNNKVSCKVQEPLTILRCKHLIIMVTVSGHLKMLNFGFRDNYHFFLT